MSSWGHGPGWLSQYDLSNDWEMYRDHGIFEKYYDNPFTESKRDYVTAQIHPERQEVLDGLKDAVNDAHTVLSHYEGLDKTKGLPLESLEHFINIDQAASLAHPKLIALPQLQYEEDALLLNQQDSKRFQLISSFGYDPRELDDDFRKVSGEFKKASWLKDQDTAQRQAERGSRKINTLIQDVYKNYLHTGEIDMAHDSLDRKTLAAVLLHEKKVRDTDDRLSAELIKQAKSDLAFYDNFRQPFERVTGITLPEHTRVTRFSGFLEKMGEILAQEGQNVTQAEINYLNAEDKLSELVDDGAAYMRYDATINPGKPRIDHTFRKNMFKRLNDNPDVTYISSDEKVNKIRAEIDRLIETLDDAGTDVVKASIDSKMLADAHDRTPLRSYHDVSKQLKLARNRLKTPAEYKEQALAIKYRSVNVKDITPELINDKVEIEIDPILSESAKTTIQSSNEALHELQADVAKDNSQTLPNILTRTATDVASIAKDTTEGRFSKMDETEEVSDYLKFLRPRNSKNPNGNGPIFQAILDLPQSSNKTNLTSDQSWDNFAQVLNKSIEASASHEYDVNSPISSQAYKVIQKRLDEAINSGTKVVQRYENARSLSEWDREAIAAINDNLIKMTVANLAISSITNRFKSSQVGSNFKTIANKAAQLSAGINPDTIEGLTEQLKTYSDSEFSTAAVTDSLNEGFENYSIQSSISRAEALGALGINLATIPKTDQTAALSSIKNILSRESQRCEELGSKFSALLKDLKTKTLIGFSLPNTNKISAYADYLNKLSAAIEKIAKNPTAE